MPRAYIRSTIFNILFYSLTLVECIILLPTLILPRRFFMLTVTIFVHTVHILERVVLNLKYEIRGIENLPKFGSYIVAAKHQSEYETLKLHILFRDPSIILKKELLKVPMWGTYLKKSGPIAIDRSSPDAAIESIQEGAKRVKAENRPIVIFPQGTRVLTTQSAKDKPYKVGVARIQEATELPIIPLALNSGMYWPKNGWFKSSGTVIFEFLPPIEPGMERAALIKKLEEETEAASLSLMNEAKETQMQNKPWLLTTLLSLLLLCGIAFGGYYALWHHTADVIKREYPKVLKDFIGTRSSVEPPIVSGFPGKIELFVPKEALENELGLVEFTNFRALGWPVPGLPIEVFTDNISVTNNEWDKPLEFDTLEGVFTVKDDVIDIQDSALRQGYFTMNLKGEIDLKQEPIPRLDMIVKLKDHQVLLQRLATLEIVEKRVALFLGAGLASLADADGVIELPLYQKSQRLYLGPLPIARIPTPLEQPEAAKEPAINPVPREDQVPPPASSGPDWDILRDRAQ